ncbi:MAG: hypothetical protein IOC63_19490 [Methylobacterium sp.]|nr:hypothetical protein [Methylobacterium sp.]
MSIDLQRMMDTAVAFFLAAERCRLTLSFSRYPEHFVSAPQVTNYAFSVEIALKILTCTLGGKKNGHNLKDLYESLPDSQKLHLVFLEDAFDEAASPFVDWRYPFEKTFLAADPDKLRRAFIVCHSEIRRTSPNLKSKFEHHWGRFDPDWIWNEIELKDVGSNA